MDFVAEALGEKLERRGSRRDLSESEWMRGFGKLKRLHKETVRIQAVNDEAFEDIEPEDRG